MIPLEVEFESPRATFYCEADNAEICRSELELGEEVREEARLREAALKERVAVRYNKKEPRSPEKANWLGIGRVPNELLRYSGKVTTRSQLCKEPNYPGRGTLAT
ncbi:hypothetical protein PIB30_020093 [Stylosanthes scabra]|uniref:Uncharacterized protein n=1 Tax=Stylosanthes scabra TaxID=79078 RepID=A0ABU6WBJ9_9FABA|nr:hypothetical protein [Stylosanthes scabra]